MRKTGEKVSRGTCLYNTHAPHIRSQTIYLHALVHMCSAHTHVYIFMGMYRHSAYLRAHTHQAGIETALRTDSSRILNSCHTSFQRVPTVVSESSRALWRVSAHRMAVHIQQSDKRQQVCLQSPGPRQHVGHCPLPPCLPSNTVCPAVARGYHRLSYSQR